MPDLAGNDYSFQHMWVFAVKATNANVWNEGRCTAVDASGLMAVQEDSTALCVTQ